MKRSSITRRFGRIPRQARSFLSLGFLLVWLVGCLGPGVKPGEELMRAAETLLGARPELVSLSHWPLAPWEGESVVARASFARIPDAAVVKVSWRGVAGGAEGKSGEVVLQRLPEPDPFTGEIRFEGALASHLRAGDALAYRVEIVDPLGLATPWVSYEESLLTQPKGAEMRGMWVDTWNAAMFTPEQVRQLVEDARRANINVICIEIRRRGDAFHHSAIEPKNPAIKPADYDPLADLIRLAHDTSGGQPRVEVHGWFVIYPVGRAATAQKYAEWSTRLRDGSIPSGETIFDPGHPDVLQYTVDVMVDCLERYPLDGVNYDYVRYLQGQTRPRPDALALYRTDKNLADDAEIDTDTQEWKDWVRVQPDGSVFQTIPTGFHPVSVERFNRLHDRPADSVPEEQDPVWQQWKRDQVTDFVRKAYVRINQVRSECLVSADTTGFGGIRTWQASAPMTAVFQDWTDWLRRHLIDANFHMGYKREHVEAQRQDYRNWTRFMIDNDGGRFQIVGQGTYMNSPEAYKTQVEFARELRAPGVIYYSYNGYAPKETGWDRGQWLDWTRETVFPDNAPVPDAAWKRHPRTGTVCGTLSLSATGRDIPVDGARVVLLDANGKPPVGLIGTDLTARTDGTGFFAFTRVPPGTYSVVAVAPDGRTFRSQPQSVEAGAIVEIVE